jgi:Uncharacterized conserved protein
MKKQIFLLLTIAALLVSCSDYYTETVTYSINEPITMSVADFRSSVKVTGQKHKIENYGKMCFYDGYLYIAENGKGIHIIDNNKPENPEIVGFIELLGNYDMVIHDNILYADMCADLVWFDITNPKTPVTLGCLPNAFPAYLPQMENDYGYDYAMVNSARQNGDNIIVGWNTVQRTEDVEHYRGSWWSSWGNKNEYLDTSAPTSNGGGSSGINGSMSSFSLYSDYLYSVMNNQMTVISLAGEKPVLATENIYIGNNVETIFNYKDAMFMGTPTGMLIYSLENPTQPKYCSQITHVYGCDPVVVEDDLAYVTIHSGNFCGQDNNELFVIDVSDIMKPKQLVSYSMTKPKGLGIDNKTLFVCDDGLKIFDATNPQTIMANQLLHKSGMSGYDVIPFENTLMMVAEDGIYQYDYSDLNNIHQISKLAFDK